MRRGCAVQQPGRGSESQGRCPRGYRRRSPLDRRQTRTMRVESQWQRTRRRGAAARVGQRPPRASAALCSRHSSLALRGPASRAGSTLGRGRGAAPPSLHNHTPWNQRRDVVAAETQTPHPASPPGGPLFAFSASRPQAPPDKCPVYRPLSNGSMDQQSWKLPHTRSEEQQNAAGRTPAAERGAG
jgi:hypothetical protein